MGMVKASTASLKGLCEALYWHTANEEEVEALFEACVGIARVIGCHFDVVYHLPIPFGLVDRLQQGPPHAVRGSLTWTAREPELEEGDRVTLADVQRSVARLYAGSITLPLFGQTQAYGRTGLVFLLRKALDVLLGVTKGDTTKETERLDVGSTPVVYEWIGASHASADECVLKLGHVYPDRFFAGQKVCLFGCGHVVHEFQPKSPKPTTGEEDLDRRAGTEPVLVARTPDRSRNVNYGTTHTESVAQYAARIDEQTQREGESDADYEERARAWLGGGAPKADDGSEKTQ